MSKIGDPLASAIKRVTGQKPAVTPPAAPATPGKPGLDVSPMAVPLPKMPALKGVEIATGLSLIHI